MALLNNPAFGFFLGVRSGVEHRITTLPMTLNNRNTLECHSPLANQAVFRVGGIKTYKFNPNKASAACIAASTSLSGWFTICMLM